jgi:hypothetical protein
MFHPAFRPTRPARAARIRPRQGGAVLQPRGQSLRPRVFRRRLCRLGSAVLCGGAGAGHAGVLSPQYYQRWVHVLEQVLRDAGGIARAGGCWGPIYVPTSPALESLPRIF